MAFQSVLFDGPQLEAGEEADQRATPAFFGDLHLDDIVGAVTAGREEYDLTPYFLTPLGTLEAVGYRHQVFEDLEGQALRGQVEAFARRMRAMREHLTQSRKLHYQFQKARWFVDAVAIYCDTVRTFSDGLAPLDLRSRALLGLRRYLERHVVSDAFQSLVKETKKLQDDLSRVTYCVQIKGSRVTVGRYAGEPDYSVEIDGTFQKFRQGAVKSYRVSYSDYPEMNHVEASVLDLVARLYPDLFQRLRDYSSRRKTYLDPTIKHFDREVQFYLSYLDFIADLKSAGLPFCHPQVSESKNVYAQRTFDLALAHKLVQEKSTVVCNDFRLDGAERIFVVSGPNQGGKTTFARTFGQLHYLARLGLPVPGNEVRLFLCDQLFTHFEIEEQLGNLRGKLQDELMRIQGMLVRATERSIVIMNETFASTTLKDALFIGREILGKIVEQDMLGVYVTFLDELSSLGQATVSMVSTVDPQDLTSRTFEIVRRPANGLAYAVAIAEKHGLTYDALKRRMAR